MIKLMLTPDQANYAATDNTSANSTQLDGGRAAYRLDVLNATSQITVSWTVGPIQYEYLRAFWRSVSQYASQPFLIDLILDGADLTEYEANIIPGSWIAPSQVQGDTYTVTATLEAVPVDADEEFDSGVVGFVGAYFDDWQAAATYYDEFVRVLWPT